ncbi:phosphodiester glycosidase family protein [Niabella beijingensis]|uniref:phosphodiester glycosidase family protein n=1 Tax=Niabella beijingensis TaxID=2872700 RepID=UPI001CBD6CFB|nr:phosphodiester glycosidase family protein [Niabella beijingensis]MBZ4189883.1 phosphodiester glycosidase family protein [Niabella beijingensis]
MKTRSFFVVIGVVLLCCCTKIRQDLNTPVVTASARNLAPVGVVAANDSAFDVTTFAGTGMAGSGNGTSGDPRTAQFNKPEGLVFDSKGNLFVADRDNHVIRKITPSGTVSLFAGIAGVTGAANGAPGVATFNRPIRIAIDNADNLYVADRDNARIRKITPAGIVSTIAGSTAGSGAAQFNWPVDVAVTGDGKTVYVADSKNHRIQKLSLSGTSWSTSLLAGQGSEGYLEGSGAAARFAFPSGVAIDNAGNIIVADRMNHCIRKVTATGTTSLLAGVPQSPSYSLDAPAETARMGQPFGVMVAGNGSIYIADIEFHTIRRLSTGRFLSTVAGNGIAGAPETYGAEDGNFSRFNIPTSVTTDGSGNFYVADVNNNKIRKLIPEARVLQVAQGWKQSEPYPGITWYYFHGNRFFLPSTGTNEIQYVNVLDIDLSVNHLDFMQVDSLDKTTLTSIIGAPTPALAALSGTFATRMPAPSGPYKKYAAFLRNRDTTYWDADIYKTSSYWVYHEGMFFMDGTGNMGIEASDMNQYPFGPVLHRYMMSGAPLLISNGAIVEKTSSPAWPSAALQEHIRQSTASRSVIAIPAVNNHVLLICAEGKAAGATYCSPVPAGFGMTTPDLAVFIKQYFNAAGALNLDGGGSASMCLKGYGDDGGVAGGLGVISHPAWSSTPCPSPGNRYSNQRNFMQDAIAVLPNE